MNQTQAIARLKKFIGPKFDYRLDPKAPDAAEHEVLRAKRARATGLLIAAKDARDARRMEVLAADAEYQTRLRTYTEAKDYIDSLPSPHRSRVAVGRDESFFFRVVASGDTWAEVVEKVEKAHAQ